MPIYEYECSKCGVFEVTQRITEKPLGKCPTCRNKVRKLISNTSFQLKGSGWYITDYGRGKGVNEEKRENSGDKGSSESGKGSSESGKGSSESGKGSSESGKGSSESGKSTESKTSGKSSSSGETANTT